MICNILKKKIKFFGDEQYRVKIINDNENGRIVDVMVYGARGSDVNEALAITKGEVIHTKVENNWLDIVLEVTLVEYEKILDGLNKFS